MFTIVPPHLPLDIFGIGSLYLSLAGKMSVRHGWLNVIWLSHRTLNGFILVTHYVSALVSNYLSYTYYPMYRKDQSADWPKSAKKFDQIVDEALRVAGDVGKGLGQHVNSNKRVSYNIGIYLHVRLSIPLCYCLFFVSSDRNVLWNRRGISAKSPNGTFSCMTTQAILSSWIWRYFGENCMPVFLSLSLSAYVCGSSKVNHSVDRGDCHVFVHDHFRPLVILCHSTFDSLWPVKFSRCIIFLRSFNTEC